MLAKSEKITMLAVAKPHIQVLLFQQYNFKSADKGIVPRYNRSSTFVGLATTEGYACCGTPCSFCSTAKPERK